MNESDQVARSSTHGARALEGFPSMIAEYRSLARKIVGLVAGGRYRQSPSGDTSGGKVVAGERYRLFPHQPNLRYLIQSYA